MPETEFEHKVEQFLLEHKTSVLTLLFADIVSSTALKESMGESVGCAIINGFSRTAESLLIDFPQSVLVSEFGDGLLVAFSRPSDSVRYALLLHEAMRTAGDGVHLRIGIHLGEVFVSQESTSREPDNVLGSQVDIAHRLMTLAGPGQTLLSRPVFDNARRIVRSIEFPMPVSLMWLNHGRYEIKGINEAIEVCEVGEENKAPLVAPQNSEKVRRILNYAEDSVLGWRPAVDLEIPTAPGWVLEEKLGEGGFGEVWRASHRVLHTQRAFKFCFLPERVRSLKREVTLLMLVKEQVGEHPGIVQIQDVYLDQFPYYVAMDYIDGPNMAQWFKERGGPLSVDLSTRLEIIAQVGDALQAAHDAGIIHRDIKPTNILIERQSADDSQALKVKVDPGEIHAVLADFGIGQVVAREILADRTSGGFTDTAFTTNLSSDAGTRLYMSPELLAGKLPSVRSDTYSLGVVLYQTLVGDLSRPVAPDWEKDIHDELLREDIQSCLAGDPSLRFASVAELSANLRSLEARRQQRLDQMNAQKALRRRKKIIAAMSGLAALLLLISVALGYGLYREQIQRAVAEKSRAEALNNLKTGLINLALSQFALKNYEAVVQTSREIKQMFPSESLDAPDLRRALRISIVQNNLAGVYERVVADPIGFVQSANPAELLIATSDTLQRFDVVHKKVINKISLPESALSQHSFASDASGGIWFGAGHQIYCLENGENTFKPILEISHLEVTIPAASLEECSPQEMLEARNWMAAHGLKHPITGIAVDSTRQLAAVVLGDGIVCRINLDNKTLDDWWYGVEETRPFQSYVHRPDSRLEGSLIRIAPDGRSLVWRTAKDNAERIFVLEYPDFRFHYFVYNRSWTIQSLAYTPSSIIDLIGAQGVLSSPAPYTSLSHQNHVIESHPNRLLPINPLKVSAISRDSHWAVALSADGIFWSGTLKSPNERSLLRRVVPRNWIDCLALDDGLVATLTKEGDLVFYDTLGFSTTRHPIALPGKFVQLAQGSDGNDFLGILQERKNETVGHIVEIANSSTSESLSMRSVMTIKYIWDRVFFDSSPDGRLFMVSTPTKVLVARSDTGETLHAIDIRSSSSVQFSIDGKKFLNATHSGKLQIRDIQSAKIQYEYNNIPQTYPWMFDCYMDGQDVVFCGADGEYWTQCVSFPDGKLKWKMPKLGGVPEVIIPYLSSPDGKAYWVKHHFGDFACFSAKDGKQLKTQHFWHRQEPTSISTLPYENLVAFVTHGGKVQIAHKRDMEGLFDPANIPVEAHAVAFSRDMTNLAISTDDELLLLETARWRNNPIVRQNLADFSLSNYLE